MHTELMKLAGATIPRPDTIQSPKDLIEFVWPAIEMAIADCGCVHYTAFTLSDDFVYMFDLAPILDKGKDAVASFLSFLGDQNETLGVGFVCECWMVILEDKDPSVFAEATALARKGNLDEHQDRVEKVMFNVEFRNGSKCMRTAQIDRFPESNAVRLINIHDMEDCNFTGRMTSYFKKKVIEPVPSNLN